MSITFSNSYMKFIVRKRKIYAESVQFSEIYPPSNFRIYKYGERPLEGDCRDFYVSFFTSFVCTSFESDQFYILAKPVCYLATKISCRVFILFRIFEPYASALIIIW